MIKSDSDEESEKKNLKRRSGKRKKYTEYFK